MRQNIIVGALAAFFLGVAVSSAADGHLGTWKLNEAKSKLDPDATKNHTVVYEESGDSVKVTVDGVAKDGTAVHSVWTGQYDGKDYAVTGDPTSDKRSYRKVDERTLMLKAKKGGKTTVFGSIVLSDDGRTRIVTTTATGAKGKKISSSAVYDRQ